MANRRFRLLSIILILVLILSSASPASASDASEEIPYESYTYWSGVSSGRKLVYSRPQYEIKNILDPVELGVSAFEKLNDVCTDNSGNTYLLDSKSRIVVLDENYRLAREIGALSQDSGELLSFEEAQSVYVHTDGTIYICDTEDQRVLCCTQDGKLKRIYTLPDSPLIPEDFNYRPLRLTVDSRGYLYVLSDGSYYGALLYDPEGKFMGFYGANEVKAGISSTLKNIWNRIFVNNTKKGASVLALPDVFVDIVIDDKDFVYTATGFTDRNQRTGQIKKFSPGNGSNILNSADVNFTDDDYTYQDGKLFMQDILGVAVDKEGFIYCLDSSFGRVFLYDQNCRMLTAFGGGMGAGTQEGNFKSASSIALKGSDVLVGDGMKNTVTVFGLTPYGKEIKELISLTLNGNYSETREEWENVLQQDRNFQPAYRGLARAYLAEGDYQQAMTVARQGYDRETYSLAFELSRQAFIGKYFWILFPAVLLVIGGIAVLLLMTMRRKVVLVKNREIRLMFTTLVHPVNTFEEIKEKNSGSVLICLVLLVLYYVVSVLQELAGGFQFTIYDPANFNSLWVLARSVGFVLLWVAGNWMVCTLLQGKGRFREILIVTCYSLMPVIIEQVLRLILTNVLLIGEGDILGIMDTIAVLYMLILLTVGLIRIHDYSMSRFLATSLLTLIGMAAIVFLMIMIGLLLQQLAGFVVTVGMELMM